jgi:hypothetical protein
MGRWDWWNAEETMAKKPQPTENVYVDVPLDDNADALAAASEKSGIAVNDLKAVLGYAAAVREEADRRKIIPPLVVTTAVNLIADMIRDFYPPDHAKRGELVTDIFHQLWHALGLPSDTADDQ